MQPLPTTVMPPDNGDISSLIMLELRGARAYHPGMDDKLPLRDTPSDWAEALDESLAELAAGVLTVPYDVVRQDLLDSLARMEAKRGAASRRKVAPRR